MLRSSELGGTDGTDASAFLRTLIDWSWRSSGTRYHAEIQETLFFTIHYLMGAVACVYGHVSYASRICTLPIKRARLDTIERIIDDPHFTGWPPSLGEDLGQAIHYLVEAY